MTAATFDGSAWADGLDVPPPLTVSQWADRYRQLLPPVAEPGPWRTERTPFLRQIMDWLSPDDPCREVIVVKGAKVGASAAADNWLGYTIHYSPAATLIVHPTVDMAKKYAKERVNPLCAQPELAALVADVTSRDEAGSTTMRKVFPGGFASLTGANSAAGLRAGEMARAILDEIDGYPADVDGEGDPVALAVRRLSSFGDRAKVFKLSTPTVRGSSRIETEMVGDPEHPPGDPLYSGTDQCRFFVPCPFCGDAWPLTWDRVAWSKIGRAPRDAGYCCPTCNHGFDPAGNVIENWQIDGMLAKGEWRPTAVSRDPNVHGVWLSGLYRPYGWRGWGAIAADWDRAVKAGDTHALQVIVNTDLGETWDEAQGVSADPDILSARVEDYGTKGPATPGGRPAPTAPAGVIVVTAGVDVQGDRLEVEIVGWGAGRESWSLDYLIISGSTSGSDVWEALDSVLTGEIVREGGGPALGVSVACVDAGDGNVSQRVYEWTRARRTRRVFAVHGQASAEGKPRPIWPKRPTKPQRGKYDLYMVGTDTAKGDLLRFLGVPEPGPGYCHFSAPHNDARYFDQLTSERLRKVWHKATGKTTTRWVKPQKRRNEALDCRVYAMAALEAWLSYGHRLEPRRVRAAVARPAPNPAPAMTRPAPATTPRPAPGHRPQRPRRDSVWSRQSEW